MQPVGVRFAAERKKKEKKKESEGPVVIALIAEHNLQKQRRGEARMSGILINTHIFTIKHAEYV